jgi:hypothetical protein
MQLKLHDLHVFYWVWWIIRITVTIIWNHNLAWSSISSNLAALFFAFLKKYWLQLSRKKNCFLVSVFKREDNEFYHHFRSEPGLKSHVWPCPNAETWENGAKIPSKLPSFQNFSFENGFDLKFYSVNKSEYQIRDKNTLWENWSQKILSTLLNFSGFSVRPWWPHGHRCETLGHVLHLNDGKTCYLPVWDQTAIFLAFLKNCWDAFHLSNFFQPTLGTSA